MRKLVLIIAIVAAVFGIYYSFAYKPLTSWNTPGKEIVIPDEMRVCTKDVECTFVLVSVKPCKLVGINKEYLEQAKELVSNAPDGIGAFSCSMPMENSDGTMPDYYCINSKCGTR